MPQSSGITKPSAMAGRGGMAPMPGQGIKQAGGQNAISKTDNNNKDMMKYSDYIRQEKMRKFKRMPRLIG